MSALIELDDLRCYVAGSAAAEKEVFLKISVSSKTEVHNNWRHRSAGSQHNVLGLEVTMHNTKRVHLLQTAQQSEHKLFDLLSCEETIRLLDLVK